MLQQTNNPVGTLPRSSEKYASKTNMGSNNVVPSIRPMVKVLFDKQGKNAVEIVAFTPAMFRPNR